MEITGVSGFRGVDIRMSIDLDWAISLGMSSGPGPKEHDAFPRADRQLTQMRHASGYFDFVPATVPIAYTVYKLVVPWYLFRYS